MNTFHFSPLLKTWFVTLSAGDSIIAFQRDTPKCYNREIKKKSAMMATKCKNVKERQRNYTFAVKKKFVSGIHKSVK